MNYLRLFKYSLIIIAISCIIGLFFSVNKLRQENTRLEINQELLMFRADSLYTAAQYYTIQDSLNVKTIQALNLTLDEYRAYRAKDLALINELKINKRTLQQTIDAQALTISELRTKLIDSIRVDTVINRVDTLKCFNYASKWIDAEGCVDLSRDSIQLSIVNRDSLKIIKSLEPKRWGKCKLPIWLFGYKNTKIDVISKNPATLILDLEYIELKK